MSDGRQGSKPPENGGQGQKIIATPRPLAEKLQGKSILEPVQKNLATDTARESLLDTVLKKTNRMEGSDPREGSADNSLIKEKMAIDIRAKGAGLFGANAVDSLIDEFLKLDYEVAGLVGQGGMSAVYDAYYRGNPDSLGIEGGRRVAIKVLSERLINDPEIRTRFFREAEIIRNMKHPNVVELLESGEVLQRPYFVMEHLEGIDLGAFIRRGRPDNSAVPVDTALYIAREVCYALDAAHSRGIIHRDIKPDNIFIVKNENKEKDKIEKIKLFDLGLAKLVNLSSDVHLTKAGTSAGTPPYMAPETIPDASGPMNYDHRIDIYSMGVTLYEMIAGSLPFVAQEQWELLSMHKSAKPEPLRKKRPDLNIPERVEKLVLRCLEKKPDDRFKDMKEMILEIEACGVEPKSLSLLAQMKLPPSTRIKKRSEKNLLRRWVAPIALSIAASAVVGGVVSYREPIRAFIENITKKPLAIYSAKIDSDIAGVSVFVEEKLDGGTVVTREIGKTPLGIPLAGEQVVYLEMDGYKRAYGKISFETPSFTHTMEKR